MFDSPVVSVHIPPHLRRLAGGRAEITASGETVGEILDALANEYPAFGPALRAADGDLAPGLAAYLGGRSVSDLQGLATPVELEEVLSIIVQAA